MPPFLRFSVVVMMASLASPLAAQVFPDRSDTSVTDAAQLLDDASEARIAARLAALRRETGTDFRIVTLPSTAPYTMGGDLPSYAGLLAESMGLTTAAGGRWALMLVVAQEAELRLDTGPAFGDSAAAVQAVIATAMRPAFANGDPARGIEAGSAAVIATVLALPLAGPEGRPAARETPSASPGGTYRRFWPVGMLVSVIVGIVAIVRRARRAAEP